MKITVDGSMIENVKYLGNDELSANARIVTIIMDRKDTIDSIRQHQKRDDNRVHTELLLLLGCSRSSLTSCGSFASKSSMLVNGLKLQTETEQA